MWHLLVVFSFVHVLASSSTAADTSEDLKVDWDRKSAQQRGLAYSAQGRWQEAIPELTEAVREHPESISNYWYRGTAYLKNKNIYSALADFDRAIQIAPSRALGYQYRGSANFVAGYFDRAISDFSRAVQLDPSDSSSFLNRGSAYRAKGDLLNAVKDLSVSLRIDPSNGMAYATRAACYSALGDFRREVTDWTHVLHCSPLDFRAEVMRGTAYSMLGDFAKATDDYRRVISRCPTNADAWNALSWQLATCPDKRFRNGQEAVSSALKACELTAWKRSDCIDTLAAAEAEDGDFESAVRYQKEALSMPAYPNLDRLAAPPFRLESDPDSLRSRLTLYEKRKPYHPSLKRKIDAANLPAAR